MRCQDCGGYKRNPDEDLRRLEQEASSGDIYASRKLSLEKHRRRLCGDGEDCWQCQVAKMLYSSASFASFTGYQIWAAGALGRIGDPASVPSLIKIMENDLDPNVRSLVVGVLAKIGDSMAIPALIKTMHNDSDWYVRYTASWALGKIGNPTAIPALIKTMKNDSNLSVREYATIALGDIGDPSVIPVLEKIPDSSNIMWAVTEALKKLRAAQRRNPGDEDLRKLERAANSGDIHAAKKLSLEKHRRRLCGDGEDCWQCQVNKMQNSGWILRSQAAETLGNIRDPAAIPHLVKAMQNDSNRLVRGHAAEALGKIKDTTTIPHLVETMKNDSDWYVRSGAAGALGKIGDPIAIPALVEMMQNDSDSDARKDAAKALKKLRFTN